MPQNERANPRKVITKAKQPPRRTTTPTSEVQPSNDTSTPQQAPNQPEKPTIIKKSKDI